MRLPAFLRRREHQPDIRVELDRDVKGKPGIYVDGVEIPDRRSERRPPPKSPGRRAEDPLDDPFPVPFVPRPVAGDEAGGQEQAPG
ncbi:MAG: hypothetical protein QOK05_1220 [Chloroflexota bacterium]|jgi:hypothetical protein|nr:hypothetical protein [Chloroflexota bacterium]